MSVAEATLIQHADPSEGLELVTGREIALEATRHLFVALDLLDPARRADLGMPYGGEELANRCLRRTNGLLHRCEITPLEFWGIPMPKELFPEGVQPYQLKGQQADEGETVNIRRMLATQPLLYMPIFPGDLIVDAIGIASGERHGVVEIEALKGVNYGGADREMQALFFPPEFGKPIELRLVQQRIEQVGDAHADPDVKAVANDMVKSCEEGRGWAQHLIDICNTQLDTRTVSGPGYSFTYSLTPKIRSLMAQLEIKPRQQSGMEALNSDLLKMAATNGITPEVLDAILSKQSAMFADAMKQVMESVKPAKAPTEAE